MAFKGHALFIYLGFYVAFNTVQVISRRVVGRAEETSIYSSLGLCTVNCRPTASNYQLSHLRPSRGSNPGLRGGRRECYHSATVAPLKAMHYEILSVVRFECQGSHSLVSVDPTLQCRVRYRPPSWVQLLGS